jgi:hypothetical protein
VTDIRGLPTDVPDHTVWPIAGAHAVTLDAVVAGLALVRSMVPQDDAALGPIDIVADMFEDTAEIAGSVRQLVQLLVQELATGRLDAAAAHQRASALGTVTEAADVAGLRVNRARRKMALADAAEIIREMGLEYHDLDCILGTKEDGTETIVAVPVAPPVAHVYLIGRLFERANQFMGSDPGLSMERSASAWYFARWSNGSIETDEATTDFPRMVREQEWSLVSRDTLGLAEPVIASFVDDGNLTGDDDDSIYLPPRQRFLAAALLRSTVGIFEVIDVGGRIMTLRDLSTEAVYRVYEHTEDMAPVTGLLLLGRIIPFDDDLWLRSQGAVVLSPADDTDRGELASLLEKMSEGLPTPIALEGLISTMAYGAEVPVAIRPAPTIAEAQVALVEVGEVLVDLGLLGDDLPGDGPPDTLEEVDMAALDAVGLGIDEPMAEWIGALVEQAALDTRRGERGRSGGKKGKRAKRSRQQRRRR